MEGKRKKEKGVKCEKRENRAYNYNKTENKNRFEIEHKLIRRTKTKKMDYKLENKK